MHYCIWFNVHVYVYLYLLDIQIEAKNFKNQEISINRPAIYRKTVLIPTFKSVQVEPVADPAVAQILLNKPGLKTLMEQMRKIQQR